VEADRLSKRGIAAPAGILHYIKSVEPTFILQTVTRYFNSFWAMVAKMSLYVFTLSVVWVPMTDG